MGGPNPVTAEEEIDLVDTELSPGFSRLTGPACSEYFQGHAGLLDHVVASLGFEEAATTAQVSGLCSTLDCGDLPATTPAAFEVLSDHCPIVVEIRDEDDD